MHRLVARRLPPHHLLAAAALAALHGGVAAQTTDAEAGKVQTITVTAERRVENVQRVPSSVSVMSSELLEVLNTSGQDVRMLAGRVPSLNIESSFGRAFPRFYIRGYGNTDFRLNASQPVSLVYTTTWSRRTRSSRASRPSTWPRWRCCAARRARCSAATRRPAW